MGQGQLGSYPLFLFFVVERKTKKRGKRVCGRYFVEHAIVVAQHLFYSIVSGSCYYYEVSSFI
jgi:hypothetical protein